MRMTPTRRIVEGGYKLAAFGVADRYVAIIISITCSLFWGLPSTSV
jgi:hypothetical protein